MKTPRLNLLTSVSRLRLLALFLVVVGARFWLIRQYSLPVPTADQWDGIGAAVLQRSLEGTLGLRGLFTPHNEHRIVLTRLLSLALFVANGQWDNLLESAADAVLCGGSAVVLASLFGGCLRGAFPRIVLLAIAVCFVLPFGWENTLSGFQSQNYFLIFFSVLAVWGMGFHRAGTARWSLGLAGAVLACLSMGSGLLAAGVVLAWQGVRCLRQKRWLDKGEWMTAALCLGIASAGWSTRTVVPGHAALKAASFEQFLSAFGRFLAWPHYDHAALGLLTIAPTLLLAWITFRRAAPTAQEGEDATILAHAEPLLALSFWAGLQTAVLAYTRYAHGAPPACRYMDLLALNPLINFLCLLALIALRRQKSRRLPLIIAASLWTLFLLAGLREETTADFAGWLPDRIVQLRRGEQNLQNFLQNGDQTRFLADREAAEALYPAPEHLLAVIADPKLRTILPYTVRQPVPLGPVADGLGGFVPDGYDPACGTPDSPQTWGDYSPTGSAPGMLRGRLVPPGGLPYLRFIFAGHLGEPGPGFSLRDAAGTKRLSWRPTHVPLKRWRSDFLPAPGREIILEAVGVGGSRWFAFSGPVEVGRWSYWTGFALRRSEIIIAIGLLLAAGLELALLIERRRFPDLPSGIETGLVSPVPSTHAPLRLFSVVIPARDEEGCLAETVRVLHDALRREEIPHEIIVVDDGSTDGTGNVLRRLAAERPGVRSVVNPPPHGFGRAVVRGLDAMRGDAAVVVMADASDDPADAVLYWRTLQAGYDCAFGSRFVRGSRLVNYPWFKRVVNRLANAGIRALFNVPLNDTTNAFKAYRREVIDGCRPLISPHFNLTVELPLKAIVRGFSWKVVPVAWSNRRSGAAKFRLKEMGSRYLFICLYVWLEKHFSQGDYRRPPLTTSAGPPMV